MAALACWKSSNSSANAYRAVYTVRMAGQVYVLHAFQKKSKSGAATPPADLDLIASRLKRAQALHARWLAMQRTESDHE